MRVYTSLNYISRTGLIPEEALPGLSFYLFGEGVRKYLEKKKKKEEGKGWESHPLPSYSQKDKIITSFCSYARPTPESDQAAQTVHSCNS